MKVIFDDVNKRLTITECDYYAIKILKDGVQIADIPLVNGTGFITNEQDIKETDNLAFNPYDNMSYTVVKGETVVE